MDEEKAVQVTLILNRTQMETVNRKAAEWGIGWMEVLTSIARCSVERRLEQYAKYINAEGTDDVQEA